MSIISIRSNNYKHEDVLHIPTLSYNNVSLTLNSFLLLNVSLFTKLYNKPCKLKRNWPMGRSYRYLANGRLTTGISTVDFMTLWSTEKDVYLMRMSQNNFDIIFLIAMKTWLLICVLLFQKWRKCFLHLRLLIFWSFNVFRKLESLSAIYLRCYMYTDWVTFVHKLW